MELFSSVGQCFVGVCRHPHTPGWGQAAPRPLQLESSNDDTSDRETYVHRRVLRKHGNPSRLQ
jgi:hypothetical protein